MLSSFGGVAMENEDENTGHESMDANQNADVGVVYDPHVERVRPWSPRVNQPPGHTYDGDLAHDGVAIPSMNINPGPASAYLPVDHPGEVMAAENTLSLSPLLPEAEYLRFFEDWHNPDVLDNDLDPYLNYDFPDPPAQGPANNVGDMEMPPVQQGNENHWAGGWESIPPGDLPGPGAPSAYNGSYSAPVDSIDPQLLLLDDSTYEPFQGTQDNLPLCIEDLFNRKQCEVCLCIVERDFNAWKSIFFDGVSRDHWIQAAMRFCYLGGAVCPICEFLPIEDKLALGYL